MEIEYFLVRCFAPTTAPTTRQSQFWASSSISNQRKKKNGSFKITARTNFHEEDGDDNPFFQYAISRASYRFQENLRPEPLFVDPYAGCFAPPNLEFDKNSEQKVHHHCIGTRFIDDQLLNLTKGVDGPKQVILFTDGMDTRAYRLNWLSSTVIYDVSPQAVFKKAFQKLQGGLYLVLEPKTHPSSREQDPVELMGKDVGAKIPKSCLLLHVPLESSDLQQVLRDKGFNGYRPSIWLFQGLPVTNLASFREILFIVSNLAMKGCLFLGEFPVWLTETKMGMKVATPIVEKWMDELFMSYGFRVRIIGYNDVARNLGREEVVGDPDNLLFIAEQLRFSEDQMETWRREFQRLEEEGEEEGFEEL